MLNRSISILFKLNTNLTHLSLYIYDTQKTEEKKTATLKWEIANLMRIEHNFRQIRRQTFLRIMAFFSITVNHSNILVIVVVVLVFFFLLALLLFSTLDDLRRKIESRNLLVWKVCHHARTRIHVDQAIDS